MLTERDLRLLLLVGLNRFLSSEQAALALPWSPDRCRRRVRKLFDHRYLDVHLLSSTAPNILSLTKQGIAILRQRYPDLGHRIRRAGTIRAIGVDHHLRVVDARLYAAALGKAFDAPLKHWFGPGSAETAHLGLLAAGLRPDGVAVFEGGSVFAIEADQGSERPPALASKLTKYKMVQARLTGLWFIACGGPRRLETVRGLIRDAGLGRFAQVMTPKHLTTRPVRRPGDAITETTGSRDAKNALNSDHSEGDSAHVRGAVGTPVGRGS